MTTRQPGLSLAEFMGHGSRGGRNTYFRDWKKRNPPAATVWLHPQASILDLWRHNFLKLQPQEKDGVKSVEVWGDRLVCYEDDAVLQEQNFYDRETGLRQKPPVLCPLCLMLEHLRQLVRDRQVDWRMPIFKFEGTDPRQTRVLHVGGITGLFNGRDLSPEQKAQMAGTDGDPNYTPPSKWFGPMHQAGDGQNVAFKHDVRPRLEYAFTIVDNDDVVKGIQIDIEPGSLGESVREVIRKAVLDAKADPRDPDGRMGNPLINPYAIRFEYTPKIGNEFPKYDAMPMMRVQRIPAVEKLLQSAPPDVSDLARRPDLRTLRARLERQQLAQLPLDSYFAPALKAEADAKARSVAPPPQRVPEVGSAALVPVSVSAPVGALVNNPGLVQNGPLPNLAGIYNILPGSGSPPAPANPEPDIFGCDDCGEAMRATDQVCLKCGKRYVVDAAPPQAPSPQLPKRSSAGGVRAPEPHGGAQQGDPWGLTPGAVAAPAAVIPPPSDAAESAGGGGWPGDPSDDIPF